MNYDPSQRRDRLRGSPFEDQRTEKPIYGSVVEVYPETCSCRIKTDDGGIFDSIPLPGLIQDPQGCGGEVFVPRSGQRVELVTGGPLGIRFRGFVATPLPALMSESATPSIFPDNLPTNQRGRVNYRGQLPKNLVPGDWCRLGNQGQYMGVFDGGVTTIFGSPWAQMNFVGAGPAMMKKLAKDHSVASPGELLQMAVDMGVKLVPCQMTMDLLGLKREDMIDGISEPAGATTMLLEAQDAVTLFI